MTQVPVLALPPAQNEETAHAVKAETRMHAVGLT